MNKSIVEELKPIVDILVEEKLLEMLDDPDKDLKLRPEIEARLKKSLGSSQKNISVEKVAAKLGLHL